MTLIELENDPRYRGLSANEQTIARSALFQSQTQNDPQIQQLSMYERQILGDFYLARAPKFATEDQRTQELFNLTQGFKSGDNSAVEGLGRFFNQRMSEDFGLFSTIGRSVARAMGHELYGEAEDPTIASDRAKAYEYFMRTIRTSDQTSGLAKAVDVAVPLTGWIGTVLTAKFTMAAGLKAMGAQNAARLVLGGSKFSQVPETGSRMLNWWLTTGAPNVASSAFDAAFSTVGEISNEQYAQRLANMPEIKYSLTDMALRYGIEFVKDYGTFMAVSAAKPIFSTTYHSIKSMVQHGGASIGERAVKDLADIQEKFLRGTLSPEELSMYSPLDRVRYKHLNNIHQIRSVIGGTEPWELAPAKGFQIVPSGKNAETFLDELSTAQKAVKSNYDRALQNIEATRSQLGPEAVFAAREAAEVQLEAGAKNLLDQMKSYKTWDLVDMRSGTSKAVGTYGTPADAFDGMFKRIKTELSGPLSDSVVAKGGMSLNQESVVRIKHQQTGKLTEPLKNEELHRFRELLNAKTGSDQATHFIDSNKVKGFLESVGSREGSQGIFSDVQVKRIGTTQWLELDNVLQGRTLYIPARVGITLKDGILDETLVGNKILDALGKTTTDKNVLDIFAQLKADLVKQVKRGPTATWMNFQTQKLYPGATISRRANGEILLQAPGKAELRFSSETNFMRDLFDKANTAGTTKHSFFEMLQRHIKNDFNGNLELKEIDGFEKVVLRDSRGTQVFSDINELLEAKPFYQPKLPVNMAPYPIVDASAGTVTVAGNTIIGSYQDIFEDLAKYTKPNFSDARKAVSRGVGHSVAFNSKSTLYELDIPGLKWSGRFSSLKETKEFMAKGINTSSNLTFIGGQKGAQVVWTDHGWTVRTLDNKVMFARNLEELTGVIRSLPENPNIGKDLLDLSPELSGFIDESLSDMLKPLKSSMNFFSRDAIDDYVNRNLTKAKYGIENKSWLGLSMATRLRPEVIKDIAVATKNRGFLAGLTQFENGIKTMNAQKARVSGTLKEIWSGIDQETRVAILPLLELPSSQWAKGLEQVQVGLKGSRIELTPRIQRALTQHRELLDDLGKLFNIDVYKFQTNYVPRIRKFAMENMDDIKKQFAQTKDPEKFVSGLLQKQFGAKPENFFGDHMRIQEFFEFATSADPVDLTMSYVHSALKARTLAPGYNQLRDLVQAGAMNLSDTQFQFIKSYMEDVMGGAVDVTGKALNDMFNGVLEKLHKHGGLTGDLRGHQMVQRDLLRTLQSLTVSATMAFKPGLIFRNAHQIYTLGSLYAPFDAIQEGSKRTVQALKADPDKFIRSMIDRGIVKPGITPLGAIGGGSKGALDAFNQLGMGAYMNSDTFNRAIMYNAVESLHERALVKLKAGTVDFDGFMKWVEADLLPRADQDELLRIWTSQGDAAAKHYHASRAVELTQHTYFKPHNPKLMQGSMVGEAFGMFGHYPISYVETLRKALTQRSGETLARTVGRLSMATLAIAGAHQSFGLDPTSYTPWGQMAFTGGPHFNFVLQSMQALNFRSFEGAQARASLLRDGARLFVPGSGALTSIQKSFELADEGDMWGAWAKMYSLPYVGFD